MTSEDVWNWRETELHKDRVDGGGIKMAAWTLEALAHVKPQGARYGRCYVVCMYGTILLNYETGATQGGSLLYVYRLSPQEAGRDGMKHTRT